MGSGREKTRPDRGLTEYIGSDRWDVDCFAKNTTFRTSATSSSDGMDRPAQRLPIANYVTPARKNVLPAQRSKTLIWTRMRGHGGRGARMTEIRAQMQLCCILNIPV